MAERLSRIPLRSSLRTPDAMRCRSDCTDVSRSSHIVTGREVSACIRSPKVLARLAAEMGVTSVVLGLPLLLNGDEGPAAVRARAFGERLQAEASLPVTMWDERLTSVQSERHLIASGVRREERKGIRDSLSAMFLLQAALDARRRK